MKYTARIDGGEGGQITITADTAEQALVQAIDWAREGDYPTEGCHVDVSVANDDDEGDVATDEIEIPSEEEKKNAELDEDGEVLGEDVGEWQTKQVIRIEDEYYYRRCNGGSRGAYDHRNNPDIFECHELSRSEARAKLLEFGLSPREVSAKTKDR